MTRRRHVGLIAGAATLLATAPLSAIYEDLSWLLPCALAVAAVVATATGLRTLRAPLWLQPVAELGALALVLTWLFPSGDEIGGILPGPATVDHVGRLLVQLPVDLREYTTPAPTLDSLMLVTVAGVGLVAVLVDLFAADIRRPALAGLPMLAIYSVPVAVSFDSVPMLPFFLGGAGYLWLLGADNVDRVRRFGRRFTGDGRDVDAWEPSPLAGAGRRLAVLGLLAALAVPLAFPSGMTGGIADRFGPGFGPGSGPGSGTGRVNLFAELHGQLNRDETVELARVTTDDPDPFYLRMATADRITDTGFEPSAPGGRPVAAQLPTPGPQTGVTYHPHRATVQVSDEFAMHLAPTYTELVGITGLGQEWLYDPDQRIVYSDRTAARGREYQLEYQRAEYDPDALRRSRPLPPDHDIQAAFAQAPDIPEVNDLLDGLVDADAAPYDQVRQILDFFSRRNGFRYDVETGPETDAPAIVDFLDHRVGFCVQYASAMAWLVRSMDLPARVVFGFTRGTGSGDVRVLTNQNLHAWTEVYFDGFGWVPFDPTPSGPVVGATDPQWAPDPDAPPDPGDPEVGDGPTTGADAPGADGGNEDSLLPEEDGAVGGPAPPATATRSWWGLGAALLALALLLLPAAQRTVQRRRRVPSEVGTTVPREPAPGTVTADAAAVARHRAHQAWRELLDTMIDLSIPVDPAETPRATARRLSAYTADSPEADRALRLLGQLEERARYAPAPASPGGIRASLLTLRQVLIRQASAPVRARAMLLPPSTVLRWRNAAGEAVLRVSGAFTAIGDLLARLSPRRLLRAVR